MFFQPPDEEPTSTNLLQSTLQSRRQKKLRRKNRLKALKKEQRTGVTKKNKSRTPLRTSIPITMSSWAENFTNAATWQLKHQIAFWKSKATALEYENKLLHDIIRKKYMNTSQSTNSTKTDSDSEDVEDDSMESDHDTEENGIESVQERSDNDDGDIEVSEEFIQFLRDNKKYRDDAKRERERLKALNDDEQRQIAEMEAGPSENPEDPQDILKKLYGDRWEKISALETSIRSQFINICDRDKPTYWPNIPFNFNFG